MATTGQIEIQRRNIVLLGKTGAGKSSVANKIAGYDNFTVKSSAASGNSNFCDTEVTMIDERNKNQFYIKIIDAIGVFDTKRRNDSVMRDIKTYFQDKATEGVNLVLFVFKKGLFTAEEREAFGYIIKNFSAQISDISALIITNCDTENEVGRQEVIDDFKRNANDIAAFMKKGIYAVGFPDTRNMVPSLKEYYKKSMEKDASALRELAMKAGEMRLGKEMFEMSFWEKLGQWVFL